MLDKVSSLLLIKLQRRARHSNPAIRDTGLGDSLGASGPVYTSSNSGRIPVSRNSDRPGRTKAVVVSLSLIACLALLLVIGISFCLVYRRLQRHSRGAFRGVEKPLCTSAMLANPHPSVSTDAVSASAGQTAAGFSGCPKQSVGL
ncbi:unnamed protein product, partial [Protopolystoma xenopodis]